MKKIMFNDKYGLTEAVLSGRKTMTRRAVKVSMDDLNTINTGLRDEANINANKTAIIKKYATYQVGEVVAVAQRYSDISDRHFSNLSKQGINLNEQKDGTLKGLVDLTGWKNKMYVRADAMPHRIRITSIKMELLQDISDEDCLREGLEVEDWRKDYRWGFYTGFFANTRGQGSRSVWFNSPRKAFIELINRVSGRGTWEKNPWVFAYTFELVK